MSNYLKSEHHIQNCINAFKKASCWHIQQRINRIEEYNKNPKLCQQCNSYLSYDKAKNNKFCSKSCSATYNNSQRIHSQITKDRISRNISKTPRPHNGKGFWLIYLNTCQLCNGLFYTYYKTKNRKTCSYECARTSSINGFLKRRIIEYYNKYENKTVYFQSTWEHKLAIWLDQNNIKWLKPTYISWIDHNSSSRRYHPDFYLKDFNLYVDPKNPYVMKLDEEKMKAIELKVHIIYGNLEYIKRYINNLKIDINKINSNQIRHIKPN